MVVVMMGLVVSTNKKSYDLLMCWRDMAVFRIGGLSGNDCTLLFKLLSYIRYPQSRGQSSHHDFNSSDQAFLLCMDVDVTTSSQGPSQNPSIVIRRLISSNPVCFEWFEPIELFLEPEYYKKHNSII